MVDRVIFLIYGVTWCVGVTMPIVIFCIYRTFLRWGWVKNYQSIAIYQLFLIQSGPELLVKSGIVDLYLFFAGVTVSQALGKGRTKLLQYSIREQDLFSRNKKTKKSTLAI